MMKIVIDDKIPFCRGVFEPFAEVSYMKGSDISRKDVAGADALIVRTRTQCDASLLEGSSVRCIATATIGFDHIDAAWCAQAGMKWTNVPGCNSSSVAQYIASVLVSLASKYSLTLSGMKLGVVGVGHVGSKVAAVGRALGMDVLLCDPPRARKEGCEGFVSLDEIVEVCDVISLHVPLVKEGPDVTLHLFDAARLAAMKKGSILINSSRGPVVDNLALERVLDAGAGNPHESGSRADGFHECNPHESGLRADSSQAGVFKGRSGLRAAVLDVWEGEPEPSRRLMELVDFATPHIAGYSADGKAAGTSGAIRFVARCLGLPLTEWEPSDVPAPRQSPCIDIDVSGKTVQEIVAEAILHTYDVSEDSDALREDPSIFEQYRGDYPLRREFPAFTVRLLSPDPIDESTLTIIAAAASSLAALGFGLYNRLSENC